MQKLEQLNNFKCQIFLSVLTVLVHGSQCQSYYFNLGQNQQHFLSEEIFSNSNHTDILNSISDFNEEVFEDKNHTIIVVKNIVRKKTNELSQTAMDIITIVWYVATFLALAAFFLLMACSDRRCADTRNNNGNVANNNDAPRSPPTPSPSYSEFAPPSYDTVIKMQNDVKTSVFLIPFSLETPSTKGADSVITNPGNNDNINTTHQPQTPTTPIVNVYTVNELQKFSS
ncbi:uncharacterized protein LOC119685551 [Teleopsis dalmanni]|uniref:uncharacterized protein LOC119685551 n=1 Tax=Teleopsis dalmanni TaxID=139649 RepID=UPI0018CD1142|nr:uncharacterized protein LOC119685551 [Teleopsis dalmanni]